MKDLAGIIVRLAALGGLLVSFEKLIPVTAQWLRDVRNPDLVSEFFMASQVSLLAVLLPALALAILFGLAKGIAARLASGLEDGPEITGDLAGCGSALLGAFLILHGASGMGQALLEGFAASWNPHHLPVQFWVASAVPVLQSTTGVVLFLGARGLGGLWRKAMAQRPAR